MKNDAVLINHEKIHHRQQLELLIVPFYIFYALNYLFNLVRFRNTEKAYLEIIFEREAYAMDTDASYLSKRELWAFISFLR